MRQGITAYFDDLHRDSEVVTKVDALAAVEQAREEEWGNFREALRPFVEELLYDNDGDLQPVDAVPWEVILEQLTTAPAEGQKEGER